MPGPPDLAGADEDRTLARLRALRSDLIDPTIAVHHGRVVKRTGDGKTANIIKTSQTPAQAPVQEGRSRSRGPARPGFSASPRIPAPHEKFPARSLLGAKKFPASPLREFCRKDLKS